MTQEDKELLLKDLCARLPYGVLCHINGDDTNTPRKLSRIEVDELDGILLDFWTNREDYLSIQVYLSEVKPYLRPMSSMMEEEKDEFEQIRYNAEAKLFNALSKGGFTLAFHEIDDWLNAHHFDYRGLIGAGLALEAPEGMYKV